MRANPTIAGLLSLMFVLVSMQLALAAGESQGRSGEGPSAATGSWTAFGGVAGDCNGLVNAVAGLPDGSVVMGGDFSVCGDLALNHVAIYHPDTDSWSALGTGVDRRVLAVGVAGNEIYIGGEFQQAGSVVARSVARWDGSAWHSLGVGDNNGVTGRVQAIGFAHGLVYIGGTFVRAGTTDAAQIVGWDGAQWVPLHSGNVNPNGSVSSILVSGNDVYVAGKEFRVDEVIGIVRWDGAAWHNLGEDGASFYIKQVDAMAMYGDELYVAANYAHPAGRMGQVSSWNGDSWQVDGYVDGIGGIDALAVLGGKLLVGGDFEGIGGVAAKYLASWDGASWARAGAGVDGTVIALAAAADGLYVSRGFSASGTPARLIARWDGSTWSTLGRGTGWGANYNVAAIAVSGSDVYVAGSFNQVGGIRANNIAHWDGQTWRTLGEGPDNGVNRSVSALAVRGSDLFVGGLFSRAGTTDARYVARWDGHRWHSLDNGPNDWVTALAVDGDQLHAGGFFTRIGDQVANHVATWQEGSWRSLGVGSANGTSSTVFALAASADQLYVGGEFLSAGGQTVLRIARWDGQQWNALGSPGALGVAGAVYALNLRGNELYVGGSFGTAGSVQARRLALWNGVEWRAVGAVGGVNGVSPNWVRALAMTANGLYVGGQFPMGGEVSSSNVVKWDGLRWVSLDGGVGQGDGGVLALAGSGTDVYVGGAFGTVGADLVSSDLARWSEIPERIFGDGLEGLAAPVR